MDEDRQYEEGLNRFNRVRADHKLAARNAGGKKY